MHYAKWKKRDSKSESIYMTFLKRKTTETEANQEFLGLITKHEESFWYDGTFLIIMVLTRLYSFLKTWKTIDLRMNLIVHKLYLNSEKKEFIVSNSRRLVSQSSVWETETIQDILNKKEFYILGIKALEGPKKRFYVGLRLVTSEQYRTYILRA